MKATDVNDTLRSEGPEGVRNRHDKAQKFTRPLNGGGSNEPPRFQLVHFDQLTVGSAAAYLVRGIIPRTGIVVVWGPPKCGKSFWTFDLAMHVAMERPYRGRRVIGGPIVYCAFEGAAGFGARAEAFRRKHALSQPVPFYLVPARMDLVRDHPSLIEAIQAQIGDTPPVVVVLDTLNRSLAGSESSDEHMAAYVKAADAIRDAFNCAVVIVHHCGIEATRPRGHTSLTGAADAQLAVKRDKAGNIVLTVEWMKDGPEGDTITSRLEVVDVGHDEDGESITSCVVVPSEETIEPGAQLTGIPLLAMRSLHEALAEFGEKPPISQTSWGVRLETWRKHFYDTSTAEPDTRQKQFVRASQKLQTLGLIGVKKEWVWAAGHAGH